MAPARSVTVNFTNKSDISLLCKTPQLSHGIWTTFPPLTIPSGATVSWESESDGVATGTEGEVDFGIEVGPGVEFGTLHLHWDNPFVGSNNYDESAPSGYTASHSGGSGNNATVAWIFDCSSSTCDGIPDDWKKNGVTLNGQFIDLPTMGATVNTPDVFIQIDWMADTTHSHAISAAAIKKVVDAFANSPYKSRTGSVGINLHVDAGPNSIMNFATGQTWGTLSKARQLTEVTNLGTGTINSYDWTAFDNIKNASSGFASTGRAPIFHYVVAAHNISNLTNSGIARSIPGSDLIVSLGSFTVTDQIQSGTLMHELGHNLGLFHGGNENVNNKPNYISVMNYSFQLNGISRGGVSGICDYSNTLLPPLDETNLDETGGLGPLANGVGTAHWCPAVAAFITVADAGKSIDWNCDGDTVDKNLNFDVNNDGQSTKLFGFNDWANIQFKGGSVGGAGEAFQPQNTPVEAITPADIPKFLPLDITPPVTTFDITPPANVLGWHRTDVTITLKATDDISGVAKTQYNLDGNGYVRYTGPIHITTEGIHTVLFFSIDNSQNVEAAKHLVVRIDKTPPEAVICYEAESHEIVVTGRDALSGVNPGSVIPSSVVATTWTEFGSDVAEERTYTIVDHASNTLDLSMKVKCLPNEYEINVVKLDYNRAKNPPPPQRNSVSFRRVLGRSVRCPLLVVRQLVSFGQGDDRTSVQAFYDVLHDLSIIRRWRGSSCKAENDEHDHDRHEEECNPRGLVHLCVSSDSGKLRLEESKVQPPRSGVDV